MALNLAVIPNGSRVPLGVFSNMQAAEFDSPTRWVPKRGFIKGCNANTGREPEREKLK